MSAIIAIIARHVDLGAQFVRAITTVIALFMSAITKMIFDNRTVHIYLKKTTVRLQL